MRTPTPLLGTGSFPSRQRGALAADGRRRQVEFTQRRTPSLAMPNRVLCRVDVTVLEACAGEWLQQVRAAWRRSTAADELGAVGRLLEQLPLVGETVTFDGLFIQWAVAEQVVRDGGAYLMVVKGNQASLLAECAAATADSPRRPRRRLGRARSVEPAHGRLDERMLLAVDARETPWPSPRQVLRLRRRRVDKATGAVLTDETVYAVTSLTPAQASPAALLRLWRRHWVIENRLHWVRDVVFAEDAATTRSGHAPQALAAFRNLALSLLHRWRGHDVTAARQFYAAHPAALLHRLGLAARRL